MLEEDESTFRYLARMETKKNQALIEQLRQEKTDLEQFKNKQISGLMHEIKQLKQQLADAQHWQKTWKETAHEFSNKLIELSSQSLSL